MAKLVSFQLLNVIHNPVDLFAVPLYSNIYFVLSFGLYDIDDNFEIQVEIISPDQQKVFESTKKYKNIDDMNTVHIGIVVDDFQVLSHGEYIIRIRYNNKLLPRQYLEIENQVSVAGKFPS